eukprot:Awhi_evm1s777
MESPLKLHSHGHGPKLMDVASMPAQLLESYTIETMEDSNNGRDSDDTESDGSVMVPGVCKTTGCNVNTVFVSSSHHSIPLTYFDLKHKNALTKAATTPVESTTKTKIRKSISHNVQHPNILTVFANEKTVDGGVFVQENFDSAGSIESVVPQIGFHPGVARAYILQIARALSEFHDNDIAHRNISPLSVFVDGRNAKIAKLEHCIYCKQINSITHDISEFSDDGSDSEAADTNENENTTKFNNNNSNRQGNSCDDNNSVHYQDSSQFHCCSCTPTSFIAPELIRATDESLPMNPQSLPVGEKGTLSSSEYDNYLDLKASDVWACGKLFFFILTGKTMALRRKSTSDLLPQRAGDCTTYSPEFSMLTHPQKCLLENMLNQDPAERFTMEQVCDYLERHWGPVHKDEHT